MKKHISLKSATEKKAPPRQNEAELSVDELVNEHDLAKYLGLLKRFAQKYLVAVAASDTPWGPKFTRELTAAMIGIGFRVDLFEKFRCPYAAAVDSGRLVFEKLETDPGKAVNEKIVLDNGDKVSFLSVSHNVLNGDRALIQINDICCPLTERGLIFVVYDKHTKTLIDVVHSDTYHNPVCKHLLKLYQVVKSCVEAHPGVLPVGYCLPGFFKAPFTDYERYVLKNGLHFSVIDANADKKISVLSDYYDEQGIHEVLATPKSYYDHRNVRQYEDLNGRYVNIEGGHRITKYQPDITSPYIYIYIFGDCRVFGLGNSDERTIESYLQKRLNDEHIKVRVENHGDFGDGLFSHEDYVTNLKNKLKTLPLKAGDMIFVQNPVGFSLHEDFPIIDMQYLFNEPHDEEFYFDVVHFAPGGNRKIADSMFDALLNQGILDRARELADEHSSGAARSHGGASGFDNETNAQLAEYKRRMVEIYNSEFKPVIGAAVMNCNPFTLGHRYLIETAAKQCDHLIVFVVEEDKSVFPFADRLKLVEEGTRDIPNVKVIPSGSFVLSSLTFSEYFNKSELQDRVIDTSLDVTVFAQEIAPCLNITKRFAGEEPFDSVTRQYNETMSRILPQYGIEFVEIPRKELNSEPISASRVRRLLDEKKFDELSGLVPKTTFEYLCSKFKD